MRRYSLQAQGNITTGLLRVLFAAAIVVCITPGWTADTEYDLVINGGRILDPKSGLDGVRSLGIRDGRIAAISPTPLVGRRTFDATGDIVGPGFIDYHAHGGSLLSSRLQLFDGVTTAIEAEMGQLPMATAYQRAAREGRASNYGWSASWALARMQVLGGVMPDGSLQGLSRGLQDADWTAPATSAQEAAIRERLGQALSQGALGLGLTLGYAPRVRHSEILALSRMAAEWGVPLFTHPRFWGGADPGGDLAATQEIVANAVATGAHWYICHVSLASVETIQAMVAAARARGARIDLEALVAETGSTFLGAEFLAPEALPHFSRGFQPTDILYYGKPIPNAEELRRLRREDPAALVFLLHRDSENNLAHRALQRRSFDFPGTILGSDGMPWQDRQGRHIPGDVWPLPEGAWAHPRSQATYTRFLALWVRDWGEFSLMDAFRLGAYHPARALQEAVPAMGRKGRIEIGADADLLVFDLADIRVNASLENPLPHSTGMRHVFVNGTAVIRDGQLDPGATPGRAIRREVMQ